ncbi:MAG: aconitate hydratase AcnA [Betaproteobacteria bacterium]|nr:aconitate hydratase AcnA [Betaproteobacteria bacterium]
MFDSLRPFDAKGKTPGHFYSLPALEAAGLGRVSRLPVSLRVVLESVLRHADGERITEQHVRQLANWNPRAPRTDEIPFVVSRIIAPEASGIPLLADLAAMRGVAQKFGRSPELIEPLVPVDLIIDHSLQVDRAGSPDAMRHNVELEFRRNGERYTFLKWAAQAFRSIKILPPGVGIIHQVNLEHWARGVWRKDGLVYPDTLVGVDSHTPMVNGIGVLGWGVGGIEAEAAMLGQPVYFLTPDVIGVELVGRLRPGVTSTDLVLTIVEVLRRAKVVGKFVEFFGEGVASLAAMDRATVANMAPEYGATVAYFPVDEETIAYLAQAGRTQDELEILEAYFTAQRMFGIPARGAIDYTQEIRFDLASVVPSVAGPRRPQDRLALDALKPAFSELFERPIAQGGFGRSASVSAEAPTGAAARPLRHGDIVIAAIASCTNTSSPGVMLAAGLLAKKAVQKGLRVAPWVKSSLTPGSRVVAEYLREAGLQPYLDRLGFNVAGFGCATCVGNSGPLPATIEEAIVRDDLIVAAVLSGNRNFEARIHQQIKANFLMSPPLVVAFAIAGRIDIDMATEPLGPDESGKPVYLRDVWPSPEEIGAVMNYARKPETYRRLYANAARENDLWNQMPAAGGAVFPWDGASTYLREPPFFDDFEMTPRVRPGIAGARILGIFGDSVTTDHISPGGAIKPSSPAGGFLRSLGVAVDDFNTYMARRANHEVMVRGTLANVRIRNLMVPDSEGGITRHYPGGERMPIYDAAMAYAKERVPLAVFAGEEYGTGSSRDWAAKGVQLLGVRALIARSFERIHRSNLVGMGVLPCQFMNDDSAQSLGLDGSETLDLLGIENGIEPQQTVRLIVRRADGSTREAMLRARIDTPVEADHYRHGGILPYVLRRLLYTAS